MSFVQRVLDDPNVLGTWALAIATWFLAIGTIVMVKAQTKALIHTLRTDALSRLTAQWDSKEMRDRRGRVAQWVLAEGQSEITSHDTIVADVADFFEEVGALLRAKRLDPELVWHAFSEAAVGWWRGCCEAYAESYRRDYRDPYSYSEYGYLVDRLMKEDKRRAPQNVGWSKSDVDSFIESEGEMLEDRPVRIILVTES